MKHLTRNAIIIAACTVICAACKTSEENYRAAYERAVASRDSIAAVENTIYGRGRRAIGVATVVSQGDTAQMRTIRVIPTEGGGGIRENLRAYNVIVGQFKQKFNAVSMRERLVDAGYPGAFVVENYEPYYYVVLSSHTSIDEAVKALKDIPSDFPTPMKDPLPFILNTPL